MLQSAERESQQLKRAKRASSGRMSLRVQMDAQLHQTTYSNIEIVVVIQVARTYVSSMLSRTGARAAEQ